MKIRTTKIATVDGYDVVVTNAGAFYVEHNGDQLNETGFATFGEAEKYIEQRVKAGKVKKFTVSVPVLIYVPGKPHVEAEYRGVSRTDGEPLFRVKNGKKFELGRWNDDVYRPAPAVRTQLAIVYEFEKKIAELRARQKTALNIIAEHKVQLDRLPRPYRGSISVEAANRTTAQTARRIDPDYPLPEEVS